MLHVMHMFSINVFNNNQDHIWDRILRKHFLNLISLLIQLYSIFFYTTWYIIGVFLI